MSVGGGSALTAAFHNPEMDGGVTGTGCDLPSDSLNQTTCPERMCKIHPPPPPRPSPARRWKVVIVLPDLVRQPNSWF